jgi:hypothetical protein
MFTDRSNTVRALSDPKSKKIDGVNFNVFRRCRCGNFRKTNQQQIANKNGHVSYKILSEGV